LRKEIDMAPARKRKKEKKKNSRTEEDEFGRGQKKRGGSQVEPERSRWATRRPKL